MSAVTGFRNTIEDAARWMPLEDDDEAETVAGDDDAD